ncbi:MAG TPA: YerC/YecD family TrpR-related protein [Ornithinimicrobium sp.]|uniref:YerC/YecD family TrpR-related protein n=1 Tax=Ornithinimicrobium sp. TaxID=1977084 RepID=UPI002B49A267|nr:YerC/YecD family TrpR-related protein [Ornithinimicrobium sp.]HKJ11776.1 YerC/YecD family TrpR-related protein [Ornithinimicrobium sp.]
MKRRSPTRDSVTELSCVLAALDDPEVVADFLVDLCTPAELEALSDRWAVVPLLAEGVAYRAIHDRTGVSVTTVGRVARCLEQGSGYRAALACHTDQAAQPGEHRTAPAR